jgi:uncharacterized repeat protein (TIGR03803 family)
MRRPLPAICLSICFGLLFAAGATTLAGQTLSDVYRFTGGADGAYPTGSLVLASDGNRYGTTQGSGSGASANGTFFKISSTGVLTTIYVFTGGADGSQPNGLIEGPDGNFYGTTTKGAEITSNGCGSSGCGTIFKITPTGTLTTLYTFTNLADGAQPQAGLTLGSDGNFYGVTNAGTGFGSGAPGTFFKITPGGSFTNLYSLNGTTDGAGVPSRILEGTDGFFYGSSDQAGGDGFGTAFKLTAAGGFTLLHTFTGSATDGNSPSGGLTEGSDGNLYGATTIGGAYNNGAFYELTPGGDFSLLYSIPTGSAGNHPYSPLSNGSDGNFYGAMAYGGNLQDCVIQSADMGCGTVYRFSPAGALTTLYSFTGGNGATSSASPIIGGDGNLYGTTVAGGNSMDCSGLSFSSQGCGTVYRLALPATLPAPVQLTLSQPSTQAGIPVTLSWSVLNAFSNTGRQCYAYVQSPSSGSGNWSGKQTGTYNPTTNLLSGSASITPTAEGTFTYALTCGGTESGFATLAVAPKDDAAVVVTSSLNPVAVGQNFVLTSTVTGAGATPTGTIAFYCGPEELKLVELKDGVATDSIKAPGINSVLPGHYGIYAIYSGDLNYNPSTSPDYTVILNKAVTKTTLGAVPSQVTPPANVTLTATVKRSAGTGDASGTVTFSVGSFALGTVNVNGFGVATLKASSSGQAAGSYPVTARYNGDAGDEPSTSNVQTVTVK